MSCFFSVSLNLSLTFRAAEAYSSGSIQAEMFDVEVPAKRRGKPPSVVAEDEEYKNVNPEKFKKLATVFQVCALEMYRVRRSGVPKVA